jgi:hypothetical protein
MNIKSPECWANDPQARAVRIELSPDNTLLLPHDEFAFSELKRDGKEQTLRLVFTLHEVLIRGHSLRRIETAMQRMELSSLNALAVNQRSFIPDGQPLVLEIVVTELESKAERAKNASGIRQ